ncbi:AraC family transcriptional regulator [Inquilinus sp. Marseille-Q2685]|uniref:helix-turn-helix domain-containing protein n=1 Tax=Inquilinus sp. Marseille-Q2685 TaxID=2866581 RepID=UPI001CE47B5B|nr:helix-turn-helix transcriptional regulator [Inquilinus sp. Marseille-Q2685]
MAATSRVLFSSPLIEIADVACHAPRSGRGCERCGRHSSITIVRRGVHAYHARGTTALAEPGLALLYRGGESYCLSHPYDREVPDRSTCIEFGPALLEEAFGPRPLARDLGTHLRPGTQTLTLQVMAAVAAEAGDRLAAEEAALGLVRAVAGDFGLARDDRRAPARRRVDRARAFIAAAPAADRGIDAVAAAAACSPFHLARLVRRETGMTIRQYRLRLRLAVALEELAGGAADLSALAVRTGFADHSHMTGSFRKVFGKTPSALRRTLRSAGLTQLSTFLQARAAAAA